MHDAGLHELVRADGVRAVGQATQPVTDLQVDIVDEDHRRHRIERPVLPLRHAVEDIVGDSNEIAVPDTSEPCTLAGCSLTSPCVIPAQMRRTRCAR